MLDLSVDDQVQDILNKMARAHANGTGCRLTAQQMHILSVTRIGEWWSQPDPRKEAQEAAKKAAAMNKPAKRKPTDLTHEELKATLVYSPETGEFTRVGRPDSVVGTPRKNGYIRIEIMQRPYLAHRLAWFYMTGAWPEDPIDHINHVTGDNRWANLRLASDSQNQANRHITPGRELMAKGVWKTSKNTFGARLYRNGQVYYGGVYKTLDEAAHAYNKLAIKHFGEFAALNPIGVDK